MADALDRHHRRSIRLKGYDYSLAGAYFVTISTQDRVCVFGDVVAGVMRLNEAGRMVSTEWGALLSPVSRRRSGRVRRDAQSHPRHHSFCRAGVGRGAPCGRPRRCAKQDNRQQGNHKGCPYVRGRGGCVQITGHGRIHARRQDEGMAGLPQAFVATQLLRTHHP